MLGDFELRNLQKEQWFYSTPVRLQKEQWVYSTPVRLAPQRRLGLLVLLLEISIPASCHLSAVSITQDPTLVPLNAILWLPSLRVLSLTYGACKNFSLWVSIPSDSKPVVLREITHKSSF